MAYQIDTETVFYPDGEQIQIPHSFTMLADDGRGNFIYGKGKNGREIQKTFLRDYGGWGWLVRKIEVQAYDCCGG
jgi:hypothetical protein